MNTSLSSTDHQMRIARIMSEQADELRLLTKRSPQLNHLIQQCLSIPDFVTSTQAMDNAFTIMVDHDTGDNTVDFTDSRYRGHGGTFEEMDLWPFVCRPKAVGKAMTSLCAVSSIITLNWSRASMHKEQSDARRVTRNLIDSLCGKARAPKFDATGAQSASDTSTCGIGMPLDPSAFEAIKQAQGTTLLRPVNGELKAVTK